MTTTVTYMTPGLVRWRQATDGPLLVIAIGSLPLLLLELARHDLPLSDQRFLDIANVLVLVAFAVDYFVELRLASNRREYVRHEWTSAVIVITTAIAIVPGALSVFGVFRVFRAVPALRGVIVVLRLLAIGGSAAREGRATLRRRAGTFALSLARQSLSELLRDCRESPDKLVQDPKKDIRVFRLTASANLGSKRGRGRGSFIDSILDTSQLFYGQVVQGLRPWTPRPPQLPDSTRGALDEAGIDVAAPRSDFTQREWERLERTEGTDSSLPSPAVTATPFDPPSVWLDGVDTETPAPDTSGNSS